MAQSNKTPRLQSAAVRDVLDELKKVTWPTREETIRMTIIVIVISLIIAGYIGIIDFLLAKGLELLTK